MKSVFLTILIFTGVFGLIKLNILAVIDSSYFHYLAYISLFLVTVCALLVVGVPKISAFNNTKEDNNEKE